MFTPHKACYAAKPLTDKPLRATHVFPEKPLIIKVMQFYYF